MNARDSHAPDESTLLRQRGMKAKNQQVSLSDVRPLVAHVDAILADDGKARDEGSREAGRANDHIKFALDAIDRLDAFLGESLNLVGDHVDVVLA
jgi:hypothetical protein